MNWNEIGDFHQLRRPSALRESGSALGLRRDAADFGDRLRIPHGQCRTRGGERLKRPDARLGVPPLRHQIADAIGMCGAVAQVFAGLIFAMVAKQHRAEAGSRRECRAERRIAGDRRSGAYPPCER